MKLISDEEIAQAINCNELDNIKNGKHWCKDCSIHCNDIAAAQLAADKAELKELFDEIEKTFPDFIDTDIQIEDFQKYLNDLKAKYLGE